MNYSFPGPFVPWDIPTFDFSSAGSVNRTDTENRIFDPKLKKKPKPTIGILDVGSVFMSHVIGESYLKVMGRRRREESGY